MTFFSLEFLGLLSLFQAQSCVLEEVGTWPSDRTNSSHADSLKVSLVETANQMGKCLHCKETFPEGARGPPGVLRVSSHGVKEERSLKGSSRKDDSSEQKALRNT